MHNFLSLSDGNRNENDTSGEHEITSATCFVSYIYTGCSMLAGHGLAIKLGEIVFPDIFSFGRDLIIFPLLQFFHSNLIEIDLCKTHSVLR